MDDLRQEQRDRACRGRHQVESRRRKQALRGQRHSESDPFVGPHVPLQELGPVGLPAQLARLRRVQPGQHVLRTGQRFAAQRPQVGLYAQPQHQGRKDPLRLLDRRRLLPQNRRHQPRLHARPEKVDALHPVGQDLLDDPRRGRIHRLQRHQPRGRHQRPEPRFRVCEQHGVDVSADDPF